LLQYFKKKKPFLRDLIPSNYVDIHSHLLPKIDDGAISIEDTAKLVKGLEEIGFKKFITTPHIMGEVWKNTSSAIQNNEQNTISELSSLHLNGRFKAAAEYMIDEEFRTLFQTEALLTLKKNYVLVEMSYLRPPIQLYDILFELQVAGYIPVLAHPERYNFFHNSLLDYRKLKDVGCLFQLNLLSTVGYYGENVAKTSDILIENGLIDFVGSDVHHTRHLEYLQKRIVLNNHDYLATVIQNNSFFDF
jgi:tyrosine-protein phosphatase YwqE